MSWKLCPLCRLPFANAGAHVPTPELAGDSGDNVFYCFATGRHVTRRVSWAEDVRRSLARAGARVRQWSRGEEP